MNFENNLINQIDIHPSVQPQDIVKLCFQAAYGAEHLLSNIDAAKEYFDKEYSETEVRDTYLYETLSEDVCRINLAAWKGRGLKKEWLFKMFSSSATVKNGREEMFLLYLEKAENVLKEKEVSFDFAGWKEYLNEYKRIGMPSVHHSTEYRRYENPAYRVVNSRYIRLLPILEKVAEFPKGEKPYVIAIDGRAASGKSTMADDLKMILDGDIVHMDDFFLPVQLRTKERLETPGGNVHYERFIEEVIPNISLPLSFTYKRFDCSKMDYCGERKIENKQFRIVEGSYSHHPAFGDYADIAVFSDVEPEEQKRRILDRDGEEMAEIFRDKWIPLEENYFKEYKISDSAGIKV